MNAAGPDKKGVLEAIGNQVALKDGWVNPVSGFGAAGFDPMAITFFSWSGTLDEPTLEWMFRGSWVARKIVTALPEWATQNGFELEGENPAELERIKAQLKRWNVLSLLENLGTEASLYGRAYLIAWGNDGRSMEYPLDERNLRGEVKFRVIGGKYRCYPRLWGDNYFDPTTLFEPKLYQVLDVSAYGQTLNYFCHQSRLRGMDGNYLPEHLKAQNFGAGDPVLQLVNNEIRNHGVATQTLGSLLQDFITKKLKMGNLAEMLTMPNGDAAVRERLRKLSELLSIHNIAAIGEEEEFEKISTSITGLPEMYGVVRKEISGAAHMPESVIYGNSASGGAISASSGYHDKGNWLDRVEGYQEKRLDPVLSWVIRLACLVNKVDPESIKYRWNTIRELGLKEEADITLIQSQAQKVDAETEAIRAGKMAPKETLTLDRPGHTLNELNTPGPQTSKLTAQE